MQNQLQKSLGNKIRKLRKSKGLNQEELAEKLNIAVNTLSNIERGNAFMTSTTIEKIADIFEISYKDLFSFQDNITSKELYNNIISRLNLIKNNHDKLLILDSITQTLI